jgi:hypothetical protein
MRLQPAIRLGAAVLFVAACVPRPATLASPSADVTIVATPGGTAGPSDHAGPTPIPSFVRPTPLPAPTFLTYTVKIGDTLTSIAQAFRTTPRSIAFWSRGEHPSLDPESPAYQPNRIEVGWLLLLIPDAVFDEDALPDATPTATAPPPGTSPSPAAS